MSKIDLVKNILADKFIVSKDKLVEDNIMERNIVHHHDISDYELYRFDPDNEDIFPFFKETKDLKKICDYILLAEQGKNLFILLIEMKLGNKSPHKQLNATELFVKYILKSAERIDCKIEDCHIRKIRICDKKRQTKPKELEYDKDYFLDYNTTKDFRIKELLF